VLVGNRLLPRHAIAVGLTDAGGGEAVLILDRGDAPVAVPVDRFDRLPGVTLPVPAVTSAAGRLWAAVRARAAGAFRARFTDAAVDSAAVDAATVSLGTRRSAALDLVTLGLAPRPELGLSRFETAWYQARGLAFAADGDPARLIRLLQELPPGGYPDRVRLLMPWLADLCADGRLRGAASELVEPFATRDADARALLAALTPSPGDDIEAVLGAYVRAAGTAAEAEVVRQIIGGGPLPGGTYGPALTDLGRHATALARCRDDPGAATDEELRTVGFEAERARRAYLAGDRAALAGDHEAARHYRALLGYVTGEPFDGGDLRPAARAVIAQLDDPATAAAGVAADPSAWPKLWRAAADGTLVVDDRLRAGHPGFGHWSDLGAAYRSLREGDRAEAAALADRIAADSDVPPLRAEALNLAAYGLWQLGRADEALERLDRALAVHPTEGVAVNAALVADGAAVLPYLARVMGLTPSPQVRTGALTRAIDLWTAGMCGPGYPPALAAMVRGGLSVPQDDDDVHRTLLTLSFRNDRAWLASATVTTTGPLQERTGRYVQRRAAYETRPSKVALRAVTVALIGVWRLHPRPAWAGAELAWLSGVFERLLEAPFDSATNPVPAVETLLGTEVLELAPSLILSVRAGAHLARAAERRGRSLPAETERKLVLEPVRTYRMRRDELDEQDRKAVSAALAAGLEAATGAIVNVTVMRNRQLVRRFRQLEMEPVQDYADGRRVVAQRIYVLDRFDGHVRRCRAYLKAMDGLPVNEGFVRQVRDAIDGWTGISSRVRRSLRAV
jgi:tetratricopeptide (TPR) repeat protein